MKRSRKGDDLNLFGGAFIVEILARHFHGQLASFGARIGEKYRVREARLHQLIRQGLLLWDLIQVGRMPKRLRLRCQRLHQSGVRMAERVHSNPRPEVEKTSPIRLDQPGAFAFDKRQRRAGIGRKKMRDHRKVL